MKNPAVRSNRCPFRGVPALAILLLVGLVGWVPPSFAQQRFYTISTVAGIYPIGDGGPATSALLYSPSGVAVDSAGNLYIADTDNHRVRKVTPDGVITTVAGDGAAGFRADGVPAASARLSGPRAVAVDGAGNLYIADRGNDRIRRVTPAGIISTVAGGGGPRGFGGDGGPATRAQLNLPENVAVDAAGNLYIADTGNHRVRKVSPDGVITTVVGTGTAGFNSDGGLGPQTQLNGPNDVAVDAFGNLYVADRNNHRVRRVTPAGIVSTYAGNGTAGSAGDNGPATLAQLNFPDGVALDADGNLYIPVVGFIRKVSPAGIITTVAGMATEGFSGDGGSARSAQFDNPVDGAVDAAGNLYIADNRNHRIRKISADGVVTTVAGTVHFGGDGGPATAALLFSPRQIAFDSSGNLYVADEWNRRVRRITPGGVISTVAGNGGFGGAGEGGPATAAGIGGPFGVAVDAAGNMFVATAGGNVIRRVAPSGTINRLVGTGAAGGAGDGGAPLQAQLNNPRALALDASGTLYIADSSNHRIRKVSGGSISTVAGTGAAGFGGDGGSATSARLNGPAGITLDAAGNLYIADPSNNRIRQVTPAGIINTVAGNGAFGFTGDGGPAASAAIRTPPGVAVDRAGNLYIADADDHIRMVTASGTIHTIAGSSRGFGGDGGLATQASLNSPWGVAVDGAGNVYVSDRLNHRIRKLTPLVPTALTIVSGNEQSGPAGTTLRDSLVVRVVGAGNVNVPGVTVTFAVTTGSARLSSTSVVTGLDGTASVDVILGSTLGALTITASVEGLQPARFTITVREPAGAGPPSPRILTGGVVGGGLSRPRVTQISSNAIISIFGSDFAPPGTARLVGAADLVNGRLPTRLADVSVQIGSVLAPIFHVFPGQLNVQAPTIAGSGNVPVQVIVNAGTPNEMRSNVQTVTLQAATPEFFFFVGNADGRNPVAAIDAVTGTLIGAPGLIPGVTFAPAKPGDILTIFATGFGATDPAFPAGELPDRIARVVAPVSVTIAGRELVSDDLLYAGVSPTLAGVYQLNIRVPSNLEDGDLPIAVQVGDFSTPEGAFLTVRR